MRPDHVWRVALRCVAGCADHAAVFEPLPRRRGAWRRRVLVMWTVSPLAPTLGTRSSLPGGFRGAVGRVGLSGVAASPLAGPHSGPFPIL